MCFRTGPSFTHCRVTKIMVIFSSKLKETGAKIVAMTMTLYISPVPFVEHNIGAKFQFS